MPISFSLEVIVTLVVVGLSVSFVSWTAKSFWEKLREAKILTLKRGKLLVGTSLRLLAGLVIYFLPALIADTSILTGSQLYNLCRVASFVLLLFAVSDIAFFTGYLNRLFDSLRSENDSVLERLAYLDAMVRLALCAVMIIAAIDLAFLSQSIQRHL